METSNIISVVGLIVALASLFWSWKNSHTTSKLNRSDTLFKLHEKVRPGRRAMSEIYDLWNKGKKGAMELSEEERQEFMEFYNEGFHRKPSETPERKKSDAIHVYLHQLHHIWRRLTEKEFTKEEVLNVFGVSIDMDSHLINLFSDAHWKEHQEKIFWQNIPEIVKAANEWEKSENSENRA